MIRASRLSFRVFIHFRAPSIFIGLSFLQRRSHLDLSLFPISKNRQGQGMGGGELLEARVWQSPITSMLEFIVQVDGESSSSFYSTGLDSFFSFGTFDLPIGSTLLRPSQKWRPGSRRSMAGKFANRLTKNSRPSTPSRPVNIGHLGMSSGKLLKPTAVWRPSAMPWPR